MIVPEAPEDLDEGKPRGDVLVDVLPDGSIAGVEFLGCTPETMALVRDFLASRGFNEPDGLAAAIRS